VRRLRLMVPSRLALVLLAAGLIAACGPRTEEDATSSGLSKPWVDAQRSGALFRGVGNEPGWSVSLMADGSIMLSMQYGEIGIRFADAQEEIDETGDRRTFVAAQDGHEVRIVVTAEGCTDDMSGEAFGYRVRLTFDDADYRGCGRELGTLPG
jgi:uncharacterized membrane protein